MKETPNHRMTVRRNEPTELCRPRDGAPRLVRERVINGLPAVNLGVFEAWRESVLAGGTFSATMRGGGA